VLHGTTVEIVQQLGDGLVEFSQAEKGALAQPATIQRSTTCTPTSALALSRGFRTRAGMTATP